MPRCPFEAPVIAGRCPRVTSCGPPDVVSDPATCAGPPSRISSFAPLTRFWIDVSSRAESGICPVLPGPRCSTFPAENVILSGLTVLLRIVFTGLTPPRRRPRGNEDRPDRRGHYRRGTG